MNRDTPSAQEPNPSPSTGSLFNNYYILRILGLGLLGLIFCVILILLLLVCVYALMRRRLDFAERSRPSSWLRRREDTSISRARIRGLDAKLVEALPTFFYTSQNSEEKLECTICLNEFVEGVKVRVLPNCKHSFHVECIATWFTAHSNCPVCRADVESQAQTLLVDSRDDVCSSNGTDNAVVVSIGVIQEGQSNGVGVEDGSNSFSSPRESKALSSPRASHSGRFSRLHSFKGMMSRGREEEDFPTSLHQTPNQSEGLSDG